MRQRVRGRRGKFTAIRRIVSAGISVMAAAHSGVYCAGFLQFVEANRVLVDEMSVVKPFADDHLDQGQMEGQIGAGSDRQPFGGFGGGFGEARIEIDDLRAAVDGMDHSRSRSWRWFPACCGRCR